MCLRSLQDGGSANFKTRLSKDEPVETMVAAIVSVALKIVLVCSVVLIAVTDTKGVYVVVIVDTLSDSESRPATLERLLHRTRDHRLRQERLAF